MSDMTLFHESVVNESEIDSLGHMNVRFYLSRVDKANRALLEQQGVALGKGQAIRRVDTYTRFHREQFAGARLHTVGGLIASEGGQDGVRAYFEIRNPDTGAVAATFVLTSNIVDTRSQSLVGIPETAAMQKVGSFVDVPEYGRPRSLSLTPPKVVTMEELREFINDDPTPGMMSGTRENRIYDEDCDEYGHLQEDLDLMFVLHRPGPNDDATSFGPPALRDATGRRYGWAMMETRSLVMHRPMAGDEIVSMGADIAFAEKTRQSRRWMFIKESGRLLGVSDTVGLCIDLDARRAIPIPEEIRETVWRNALPQFA